METYISSRKNMLVQFIADRHILDLFLGAERRPVERVDNSWWEQDIIDLAGVC